MLAGLMDENFIGEVSGNFLKVVEFHLRIQEYKRSSVLLKLKQKPLNHDKNSKFPTNKTH
jgi:hypothetical protein